MNGGIFAVVPVKPLEAGKSRLQPILGDEERLRLNRQFLAATLDCIAAFPGPETAIVVSSSQAILTEARRRGMIGLAEPTGGGLNGAVAAATRLTISREARGLFILPVDLPQASPSALRGLIAGTTGENICLLVPDRHGTGTNLLYQSPLRLDHYEYGPGSLERHRLAAEAAGLTVFIRPEKNLAFDVDDPVDYALWHDWSQCPDSGRYEA